MSLLFSTLYGTEFVASTGMVVPLEKLFFQGVRRFYGLPNAVSNNAIRLLFPDLCIRSLIVRRKFSVLLRVLQPSDTYFPEAGIFDRETLLYTHSAGFSFLLWDWLLCVRSTNLFTATSKATVRRALHAYRDAELEFLWVRFGEQSSTEFAAHVFGSHVGFYEFFLAASKKSGSCVRVLLLIFCGAISWSYADRRCCPACPLQTFTARHFFLCPALGPNDASDEALRLGHEGSWNELIILCLSRFRCFKLLLPDPSLSREESELLFEYGLGDPVVF